MGHLKDAFFITLDDVQERVVGGLDGALDRLERLSDAALKALRRLQDSQVGRAATTGLDEVLSRVEDATAYYLPLPPTLREYRTSAFKALKKKDFKIQLFQCRNSS